MAQSVEYAVVIYCCWHV